MDHLDQAIAELERAIAELTTQSEEFYEAGDNRNGNIRADAVSRSLLPELKRLRVARDYLGEAIARARRG